MRLKTQNLLSITAFSILLIIIVASVFVTSQQTAQLSNQETVAQDVQTRASNLQYLANDYFLYQENPVLTMWQTEYNLLSLDLPELSANSPAQQIMINNIKNDSQFLNNRWADVTTYLANADRNVSIRVLPTFQAIWSRMSLQNQALLFHTQQLSQSYQHQIEQLNITSLILIFALLGVFGAYFVTYYLVTFRNTLKSISDLQSGIAVIGSGNLDHTLKAEKKDEIGEISLSLNLMTANLKTITASKNDLQKEIEERKKAEEALREVERDLNRAQIVGKIGSWRLDTQRNVLHWSDENHRIFGVPMGTPMTYEAFLSIVHPEDRDYVDREWKSGLRGEPYDIEHRTIVDGKVKWVREKAELEFDKDGKLIGGFGTTQEITDFMEMMLRLEDASAHLQEYAENMEQLAKQRAEKLKDAERLAAIGATAGMVGHDIRNPLQAITGDLYLVKTELAELPDNQQKKNAIESLDEIQNNIDYINKIVADLQDYARPLNPRAQETDITSVFNEMLTKNGIPKTVKVIVDVEDEARKVMADPDYLKRIVGNLTLNAVQAMPDGGILTIRVYVERQTNDTLITVRDTGVGIPEDVKSKLFTPMMTTKSKGQGFGLAVVKRMTEGLGGTVTFESTEGKGTTFIVRLPPAKS